MSRNVTSECASSPEAAQLVALVSDVLAECARAGARWAEVYAQMRESVGADAGAAGVEAWAATEPGVGVRMVRADGSTSFAYTSSLALDDCVGLVRDASGFTGAWQPAIPVIARRTDVWALRGETVLSLAEAAHDGALTALSATGLATTSVVASAERDVVGSTDSPVRSVDRRSWRITAAARTAGSGGSPGTSSWARTWEVDDELAAAAADTGRRAAEQALRLADARPYDGPAGPIVVFGPGSAGTFFHETCGHGLEGDTVRRGSSALATDRGRKVASELLTVVDRGTVPGLLGCDTIDDEGNDVADVTLIADGRVVGCLSDRASAAALGSPTTGHGRRQDFARPPTCRMRHTVVEPGEDDDDDVVASTEAGLFVTALGGGDADPRTGRFSFAVREAREIRGGRLLGVVRPFTMTGRLPDVLPTIDAIGRATASGHLLCRKDGQLLGVSYTTPLVRARGLDLVGRS